MSPYKSNICVLIAAKDADDTIGAAVISALRQPEVSEVVVIVDGGSDNTAAVALSADDGSSRLKVLSFDINRGPSAARNVGLAQTAAEFVCVLDADDRIEDERFSRLFQKGGEDWDLLADDLLIEDGASPDGAYRKLLGLEDSVVESIDAIQFIDANISRPRKPRTEMGFLKPLMRSEFLKRFDIQYDEQLRLGEDYELYVRALLYGARFKLVSACGYIAVQRPGSLSHRHRAEDLAALAAADQRLVTLAGALLPDAKPILRAHYISISHKAAYRLALDAKRNRQWSRLVWHLFKTPATTVFILRETLRAHLASDLTV